MAKPTSVDELYRAARDDGHRRSLGRLLTLVERGGADAETISELAHPDAGRAHIIGITGAPGAGKSTLTGQLVSLLIAQGHQPAILAVDPSSPLTGGAILGDRIRMDDVVSPIAAAGSVERQSAFIRSMATRGHSGGLALAVPLAVRLFDAVGYGPVIIETVGVGQVEVDVVGAADTAIVVVTPGMGDAVQANKAGLLEVADVFVVNKADRPGANDVRRDLELMLDLSHMTGQERVDGYRPPIVMSSAIDGTGAADVLQAAADHLTYLDDTGQRAARRQLRIKTEIQARMEQKLVALTETILASEVGAQVLAEAEQGKLPPTRASSTLLDQLFRSSNPTT
ncbi:MAG: methylmalonyl Co-A mutase-associated GTPase MeaB [Actinomycetia bacterium]|nr:methylmalonyl Co-A mutase-associated GTPase MeaB [Actinomycetes bacterium]MCP4227210.1 methylmalonyl Co-A mutase-associated GTPase MeaB [Actinomycetes bacterium]MCP5035746.1 methylmalonyl Co-A mutase-associated GTPase MeaB [Actinomycetes bacterium]